MLGESLYEREIKVIHEQGNADVKIIKNVVEKSYILPTPLVGDGANLIVLLLFHVNYDFNKMH